MTKHIAILSGKGGVGKTISTINLGMALKYYGRDALIVDANIKMPNIGLHLGHTNLPTYLNHVLKKEKSILESIYRHPSGLKIIPASIAFDDVEGSSLSKLKHHITELKDKVEVVLLDCAAGIGEEVKHILELADEALVVTNPDMVSVTDALRTIRFCEDKGVSVLGIVVNKIKNDGIDMSSKNIESILTKPILGEIPYDESVRESIKVRHPIVYWQPESEPSKSYKRLASRLIGDTYFEPDAVEKKKQLNWHDKIYRILGLK